MVSQAKLKHRRWSKWTIEAYHIPDGNANIISYLSRNIVKKYYMEKFGKM